MIIINIFFVFLFVFVFCVCIAKYWYILLFFHLISLNFYFHRFKLIIVILHYPRNNDIIQWNWKNWNDFNLWRGWNIFYKHFDYKYPEKNYPTRQNGNQIFLNNQKKNQKNNEWSRITEENAFGKKKCKNTTFSFGS